MATETVTKELKVLIVDDDPDMARIIMWRLRRDAPDFDIEIVEGGQACLERLQTDDVDCVLSDYQMPGMDGMELLQAIRARDNDVPFIFLTGQGNEEVAADAFRAGANDYYTKETGFAHFSRIANSVRQTVNRQNALDMRREAEEQLADREERFRMLFESANDAIFLMDGDTFIECNDKTVEMFGCENREDIISRKPYEFSPKNQPDGKPSRKKALELIKMALGGKPQRFNWLHTKKDGSTFDAEVSLNSLELHGRKYLQAIVRDISERMLAEGALIEFKEFSDAVIRSMPGAFYVYDDTGMLIRCNETYEEIVGPPPVGILDMVAEEDRERTRAAIDEVMAGREYKDIEITVVDRKGKRRSFLATGSPLVVDGRKYLVGVALEISYRKKLEEELAKEEERYRTLFNSINDAVFVHHAETGVILEVNDRMCEMYGYTREEAARLNVGNMSSGEPPYTQDEALRRIKESAAGRAQQFTWMAKHKSGRLFPVEVNMVRASVADRNMVLVTVRDISGRGK